MMSFWASLSAPWQVCLEEAWAAYRAGSIPVGAVLTDAEGRILILARNRTFERNGVPSPDQASPLAHAELNALAALDRSRIDPLPCILYTSTEPCPLCLGALYMSGVRELRYAGRDPYAGSVNLLGTTPYLRRKPIRVVPPESAELETVVTGLHTEFGLRFGPRYAPDTQEPVWLEAWRSVLPDGVGLGEAIFRSGWLQRMRDAGAPVGEVIEGLADRARLFID